MAIQRHQLLRALVYLYGLAVVLALGSFLAQVHPLHTHFGKTQSGSIAVVHIMVRSIRVIRLRLGDRKMPMRLRIACMSSRTITR